MRRHHQHSLADREGYYKVKVGEQLNYRYQVTKVIDSGAFGSVVMCKDCADPKDRLVAAKISKSKKFDVDNANVEIKILKKLQKGNFGDNEGKEVLVQMLDHFLFRRHVVIIFELLHFNLYKFQKIALRSRKHAFDPALLKRVTKQVC